MSLFDFLDTPQASQQGLIGDLLASLPAPAPGDPGAPSVPISTSNFTPPPTANPPVAASQLGIGGTPFQFPQSAAFGATLPAPASVAAPRPVPAPAVAAPDDDDDAPAAPQNAPIQYGNVSVPRIGGGFNPATAPGTAPANPLSSALNGGAAFLNRAADGLQSVSRGGSLTGAIRGQYDDPRSYAQAQLQKQVAALVNAGVPQQQAVLAVLNPEAGKSIIPQYVGPDKNKFVKIGQDGLGREQYGFVNEQDKTVTPAKTPGGANTDSGLGDMSKTGAAYLATLPPQQRGTVQAMVEGRMAPPSSFALSKPYWQNMIAAAQNVDPTFDSTQWSGRVAGVKDFASGKSAEMVRSANQTLQHVNALLDSADALHNGNYPSLNWVGNKFNEATGGGEPGAFKTNAHAVADEMSKVFKGGNLSDSEIRAWEENLSPNMSPAQQRAQIGKLSELLHGSLQALEEKRVASIGQAAADKAGPIIKPEGQKVLARIDQWVKSNGSDSGAGNTTPTGVKWSVVQ